jgi:plastocyanin
VPTPTASPTATGATPTPTATPAPTATPTATPTAQPQVIHVGFTHAATTDPTFGVVRYYSPTTGAAAIVTVVHGSHVVFLNDDTGTSHTGSGLGSSGFPTSFDNTSGFTQSGTTIDSSLTWSTGTLTMGSMSQVFTVGAPGDYYFGCAFHYNSSGMRDVLVST